MATKTISQLSALDNLSTNLSSTLFVVYDSVSGTTRKATLAQIDSAIETELGQASSGAVYANAAFQVANTALAHPIMLEPLSGLTITQNYTIPNNYRGVSRGTVTINNNVTVTISETAEWLIDN
jgi:hypothetical protein